MDNGLNENTTSTENTPAVENNTANNTTNVEQPEVEKKKHGAAYKFFRTLYIMVRGFFRGLWWLIKLSARHVKASLIVLLCLLVAALLFFVFVTMRESDMSFSFGSGTTIEDTPTVLTEVRNIGQWEFLSISDEELVDTVRKGIFSDDELIRIYYGTLSLGIDFSKCEGSWVKVDGDSLILDLPAVQLLDENFIDEARTQPFIETGSWSNADRQAMTDKAKRVMRERCLTPENLERAQKNAERQVRDFLSKVLLKKN